MLLFRFDIILNIVNSIKLESNNLRQGITINVFLEMQHINLCMIRYSSPEITVTSIYVINLKPILKRLYHSVCRLNTLSHIKVVRIYSIKYVFEGITETSSLRCLVEYL